MYWGKDKNISFFYLFHIRIYFIIRAKIRFYFETNKKNHKKLRKNCDNCDRDRNGKKNYTYPAT